MAHFAQLDENNMVVWVTHVNNSDLMDENGVEQESLGIQHIHNTIPGSENYAWKQTSYNSNFRGGYASIGGMYHEETDTFIRTKPFDSWVLNSDTLKWESPVPRPNDIITDTSITTYRWIEESLSWEPVIDEKPYPSWTLLEEGLMWTSPISHPDDGRDYQWNEENQSWDLVETD